VIPRAAIAQTLADQAAEIEHENFNGTDMPGAALPPLLQELSWLNRNAGAATLTFEAALVGRVDA